MSENEYENGRTRTRILIESGGGASKPEGLTNASIKMIQEESLVDLYKDLTKQAAGSFLAASHQTLRLS